MKNHSPLNNYDDEDVLQITENIDGQNITMYCTVEFFKAITNTPRFREIYNLYKKEKEYTHEC